jgi:Na+/proline symporter
VKPLFGEVSDKRFLLQLRIVLVLFTAGVLVFALNNTSTMYEMVQNAYKVTLVGAFIPLVCGIYWNRASTQGAASLGRRGARRVDHLRDLLRRRHGAPAARGLLASAIGMVVGSVAPQVIQDARQGTHARA